MASAPRRLAASLVAVTALTSAVAVVTPAVAGSFADPIVKQAPPSLLTPANDTSTPVKDVVLQWSKVPYASSYEVQLSPNGDFTNNTIELPNKGIVVPTTYEVPLSLPHDEYYWRVRGVDANAHTGWSKQRQFLHDWAVPMTILQQPTSDNPTIAWAPVPEASLYDVEFNADPTFPSDSSLRCFTAATMFTPYGPDKSSTEKFDAGDCFDPAKLTTGTTYYYRVIAYDDSSAALIKADNAPNASLNCADTQPECDALTLGPIGTLTWQPPAPGQGSSGSVTGLATTWHTSTLPGTSCDVSNACPNTPTFSWTAVPGAVSYRVAIFRDPYATNVYRVYDTIWPTLTPREAYQDAQAGHAYYWNVVAYVPCDPSDTSCTGSKFGGISATAVFAKRSDPPVLQAPAQGSTIKTPWVTFKWDDYLNSGNGGSLEARNYHLQISPTQSFDKIVAETSDIDMTQWTDPTTTLANGVYYWRVQGLDESGNQLTWSEPKSFTFDGAPPTLTITSKDGISLRHAISIKASEQDIVGAVSPNTVRVLAVSTHHSVPGTWNKTGAATWAFKPSGLLIPGESYALSVSGLRDQAGNAVLATNNNVRTSTFVDDRNAAISYSSRWARASSSNAKRGTYSIGTSGSGNMTVVGNKISVYACKGPSFGTAVVRVDGHRVATIREKQEFTQCGVLVWTGPISSTSAHTLQFAQSSGSVALDAVTLG